MEIITFKNAEFGSVRTITINNEPYFVGKDVAEILGYRSNYNKQIKEYNRYIRKFPARMFLSMLGYETQEYTYLDYDVSAEAPQNLFED